MHVLGLIMIRLRQFILLFVALFSSTERAPRLPQLDSDPEPEPEPEPKPKPEPTPKSEPEPEFKFEPAPKPPATVLQFVAPVFPHRPGKWVKPKGELPLPMPVARQPRADRPPRPPRPAQSLTDDPELWGQYYFRNSILDQLDLYWFYLRRMKEGDKDSYELLKQIGIQLMPHSATMQYDMWRDSSEPVELSSWWRTHRPSFGAIAYGFDNVAALSDTIVTAEFADPERNNAKPKNSKGEGLLRNRPCLFGKSSMKYDRKTSDKPRVVWTPRFLYFSKYARSPSNIEHIEGGDVYALTVYWDRADNKTPKRHGVPQSYAVWVQHGGTDVKILRMKRKERIELKWAKGPRGRATKRSIWFPQEHWTVPDEYLRWAHHGREADRLEPLEYLRRMFVEAATMYETSTLGSMVRIAVNKRDLTAVFGVEIKRTSYFFKDRDVVLTVNGRKKRIFHIVRPHVRRNGKAVPMHFRGLREFDWAGYKVSITVPGLHHFMLPEFDVGVENHDKPGPIPRDLLGTKKIGSMLAKDIKTGLGAFKWGD
jgi:hypothetical protein